MTDEMLEKIAREADLIVAGYAFTKTENGFVRVLNLENPDEACVLSSEGEMIETTMDDSRQALAEAYYVNNIEFMEVRSA